MTLSNSFREVSTNGVLLLYLSATTERAATAGGRPGLLLARAGYGGGEAAGSGEQRNALYDFDLMPLTRKALFVVIDSPNATSMKVRLGYFGTFLWLNIV